MRVLQRFTLDHEEGDSERDADSLRWLAEQGVELGAAVTLWYCDACDFARGDFAYEDAPR